MHHNPIEHDTHRQADKQTGRQASRQTDRQTDRQIESQAGRQAGRQANLGSLPSGANKASGQSAVQVLLMCKKFERLLDACMHASTWTVSTRSSNIKHALTIVLNAHNEHDRAQLTSMRVMKA